MPKAVQVRNVPDAIHRSLRARAADAGMSLSDYLLMELTDIAARTPVDDVITRIISLSDGDVLLSA